MSPLIYHLLNNPTHLMEISSHERKHIDECMSRTHSLRSIQTELTVTGKRLEKEVAITGSRTPIRTGTIHDTAHYGHSVPGIIDYTFYQMFARIGP